MADGHSNRDTPSPCAGSGTGTGGGGEMIESIYWMDGYGPYVWAAWLIAGFSMSGLLLWAARLNRQARTMYMTLDS